MRPLAATILAVSITVSLAGCAPDVPAGPSVEVARSLGTVQCEPDSGALNRLERELTSAGIQVLARSEADDGMMRIALCGSGDGRLGIFTIPGSQLAQAEALGFRRR